MMPPDLTHVTDAQVSAFLHADPNVGLTLALVEALRTDP